MQGLLRPSVQTMRIAAILFLICSNDRITFPAYGQESART
jgi:hypothetical protein